MSDNQFPSDQDLGRLLREIAPAGDRPGGFVEWRGLEARIAASVAAGTVSELRRRRRRQWRRRALIPAALAATVALLVGLTGRDVPESSPSSATASSEIDALLDSPVSDDQFRTIVVSASDDEDLLQLAIDER